MALSRTGTRRRACAAAAIALTAALAPAPPAAADPAPADPAPAVVTEVYGGGGNSGATLRHDFVELGNPGDTPVALDGWSVQYLPARPSPTSRAQVTPLSGSVAPGGHYLVRQAQGAGGTVDLPAPDAAGTTAMAAGGGVVALVADTAPITCRTPADCAADPAVVDLVGVGAATVHETAPAPATTSATSAARDTAFTDTGDNSADFTAGAPTPVNAAGEAPGDGGDGGGPQEPGPLRVHDVQGTTRVSPHDGAAVTGVPGVVTAVNAFGSARGFWFQDPDGDGDPRTSEGLFVFTGATTPDVAPGDEVLVSGRVGEYTPAEGAQGVTQLGGAVWTVVDSGRPVPAAVDLEPGTVPAAYAPDAGGDVSGRDLRPDAYALDFWEAHEHMVVRVEDARVVGPTDAYGALWVTTEPDDDPTVRGGTAYSSYADPNSGRLKVESLLPRAEHPFPAADVGDALAGATEGPLYYSGYGGYLVKATALGAHVDNGLERTTAADRRPWELSVATYNVENLSAADGDDVFARLATGVADHLGGPDIVALEEIQDDNGPADDGTVTAGATLDRLTAAIEDAGGPAYQWRQIDPEDGADGGQPGGNIRNAFLFDPERVEFVDRPGGDATTPVEVVGTRRGGVRLSVSPGRIAPADAAWTDSRKPLAGEFRFRGRTVVVVTNHFASKGGDQPLHGPVQPPVRGSEEQRHAQAEAVRAFADEVAAADPDANLVVAGDLNDFEFSRTLDLLTGDGGLVNPMLGLPAGERYNYVYDGNSQALDHMLVAPALAHRADYEIVRINAEFHDRASDHDPQLVSFRPLSGDPRRDAREDRRYYPGR